MSLTGALNAAVSALAAQSQAVSAVANNLANANTAGYKTSTTFFESLVAGSGAQASGGVLGQTRTNISLQGMLTTTSNATDVAIDGGGFFVVSDAAGGRDRLYTRNGAFSINDDGYLVNDGFYLMGWRTDADGNVIGNDMSAGAMQAIDTNVVAISAAASSKISFKANLPSDAATGDTFTSSVKVYDSLGTASNVAITWTKTGDNTWTADFANPTLASNSATPSGTVSGGPITVTFNSDGTFASTSPSPPTISVSNWVTGAADSSIALDFGTAGGANGLTQYSSGEDDPTIDVDSITADGMALGKLKGVKVGDDGAVIASYDNGQTRTIYKIAVATFPDPDGLQVGSDGMYAQTDSSGAADLHLSGEGGAGTVEGSTLEASTTDTSQEFSTMMSAQQAYSAAAQVMSTVNQMFQTLISDVK
jgi:flagellar hook protein FlgE